MMIPGYQIQATLYQSDRTIVYRALRTGDALPVILKQLRAVTPEAISRFQAEYDLMHSLHLAGIIQIYGLESDADWVMVEEDGGISLDRLWTEAIPLSDFFPIALSIVRILRQLHQQNLLHGNLNPTNILFNPATGQVKLIDFERAALLAAGRSFPIEAVPYLSPELTGRTNSQIDYRTDFYTLGVTFYQLLSNQLPFGADDPLECIHCHIAKTPAAPDHLNPQIPPTLAQMVMKLLAKDAADRYQSAWGLEFDLQTCWEQWQQGEIQFQLAQQDGCDRFQISETLYGRSELLRSAAAFCQNLDQATRLLLIQGAAGIGKSSFVKALRHLLPQNGYWIYGSYAPPEANLPNMPLLQALQTLVRQLLTEKATDLPLWREKLRLALGSQGQALMQAIPELELLVGPMPTAIDLPTTEAQNRLQLLIQRVISLFAQPDRPLVLVLDQLQWADRTGLDLLQLLLSGSKQSLLIISTTRDQTGLSEIAADSAQVQFIVLPPLQLLEVQQWLAETLRCDPETVAAFARLIEQKTGGNPFFIQELLHFLYQRQLIQFDYESRQWQWNLKQIESLPLADTAVELIFDRWQQQSVPIQTLLQQAACIGYEFDLEPLQLINTAEEMVTQLQQASEAGLIIAADRYQFSHPRLWQAIYAGIPEAERRLLHAEIGRKLYQSALDLEQNLFEIVRQLNLGTITADLELARLNLLAGEKAKASAAYAAALRYFNCGRELLPSESWQSDYELTLALYEAAAEAAYLNGDFDLMNQLIDMVQQQAKTVLDMLKVCEVHIQACIAQRQFSEAIEIALGVLNQLQVKIPRHPRAHDLWLGSLQTKLALSNRSIQDLAHLPSMSDPNKLAAMRIIASVCTPTYFVEPQLWQLLVFQKVQLSLQYGNAPGSAFGYGDYGMVLCGVEANFDRGYEFAQLAARLLPRSAKPFVPKTLLLINIYLRHWRDHLQTTLEPLQQAYNSGLETGDLEYATFAIAFYGFHAFLVGQPLQPLAQEMASFAAEMARFKQEVPLAVTQVYWRTVLHLLDATMPAQQDISPSDNAYIQFHVHLSQLIEAYLINNYAEAVTEAIAAEQLLEQRATGMLVVPVFYFYRALSKLAVFDPEAQQSQLAQIFSDQKQMQIWADHAPMNYLHKYYLITAELNRVSNQNQAAAENYDRAIELAYQNEYIQEAGLAHELAGRFYLNQGRRQIAQVYFQEAYACYLRWGAIAKAKQLEQSFIEWFDRPIATLISPYPEKSLDLASVIKAAQVISGEMVLDKLLTKLMQILLENAGAELGYLILQTSGEFSIVATATTANTGSINTVAQTCSIDGEAGINQLATRIVHYVASTKIAVVVNHAIEDERFQHDPYVVLNRPKSILCAPLIEQGQLIGLIYLENNLTSDAFTIDRLETVQLLAAQAAISIENARLYDEMELRIQARTQQLTAANQQLERLTIELQRSNQELEQFAYVASHDLQEPLRTIISYTELLKQRYQNQLDQKADLYIHFAIDGAMRMQRLIQDLLAYSRIDRQKLKFALTDCNAIVQQVLRDLQTSITETGAVIVVDPLPILYADATQLSLLFQNLIGNAIKYRRETPEIKISAVQNQATDAAHLSFVRFSVQDNGIGIAPEFADRIFGIFQRLHTQEEYAGTGLGLAIGQKVVQNHGGRIWVESQMSVGATFYFDLPLRGEGL